MSKFVIFDDEYENESESEDESDDLWNQISNYFFRGPERFEEDGKGKRKGKNQTQRTVPSIHYFRRIFVCDGIVKTDFFCSESVLADSRIWIPENFEILESFWFDNCKLVSSIVFESNIRLHMIGSKVFSSSLKSIFLPRNVEILGLKCFSSCKSLSSIIFESNSCLKRIDSEAF
jgi:hypothetical protein